MRIRAVTIATLLATTSLVACVPQNHDDETVESGGTSNGGNTSSKGGITTSGGKATGGNASTGGRTSSTGGNASTGGQTSSTGGDGGSTPRAGNTATGGNRTGGTTSSGGTTATGGSSGTCTDVQPPGNNTDCATWKSWNNCEQQWFLDGNYCQKTCGRCSGTSTGGNRTGGTSATGGAGGGTGGTGGNRTGGTTATGGSTATGGTVTGPGKTNPAMTGNLSNGYATRYWDCCKPSCSWTTAVPSCGVDGMSRLSDAKTAKSGCEGGTAFECYDFSPWYDASTNMSYGFVAHNGVACGTCYMFQFTGEGNSGPNAGASALKGQQMIVQTINIGGLGGDQFDILIPGGGVGDFAAGCQKQWGSTGANTVYGGMLSDCKGDCACMKGKCSSFFGSKPALKAGCDWFTNWYSCADNPKLQFKQVSCPSQITQKTGVSG